MLTNYYNLLKVSKGSDIETIKKAFRKEIALYHPDNNTSPEAKSIFENLIEAFDVLSNPKKRKAYDEMLRNAEADKPVVITEKQEETYKEWQKEAKKKSKTSWESSLTDLLLLDLFFSVGFFEVFEDIGESLGDAFGDVFDLF